MANLTASTTPAKVGIVVVSYNASRAVRITLASLRQARNAVATKLVLVDNASLDLQREEIRSSLEKHVREAALPWEYLQEGSNRGFAGGNNDGIRRLLQDPEVTHICLLNSDVIVTDHWLDHLLETGDSIVSAVTNKAESEQCVPVDYQVEMGQCLDESEERVPPSIMSRLGHFADDWRQAWHGNRVEGEATFFCVLIARHVLDELGPLDEHFFPGGYEDDDFCIRARSAGHQIMVARDVFIHHWGSASFGQLQYEYFNSRARQNREYLEAKHGIVRQRRPEKPFLSYAADLAFATRAVRDVGLRQRFNQLYAAQLGAMLEHFESEFKNLSRMLLQSREHIPEALSAQLAQARAFDDVSVVWQRVQAQTEPMISGRLSQSEQDGLFHSLDYVIDAVFQRVECNFAMHGFLFPPKQSQPSGVSAGAQGEPTRNPPGRVTRLINLLRRIRPALSFLWYLRGIVIFGGYPYPERLSDGYFQRIRGVDRLLAGAWRVYVESDQLPGRDQSYDRPEANVLVLRIRGGPRRRLLTRLLALVAVLRCRRVYFHSILRMRDNGFGQLMRMPGILKVIDVHGVVPEEFAFEGKLDEAELYNRVESLAIRHADIAVVVTNAMEQYLRSKHGAGFHPRVVTLPMFADFAPAPLARPYEHGKPIIVYAGGLHKWQQVPKMLAAMQQTASQYSYRFYCPDPGAIRTLLPPEILPQIIVDRKTQDELGGLYAECHYGFILRQPDIVNRVACPTKLVEYLARGIVPIVDSEDIGDFKAMGMQSVPLGDLLTGALPDEPHRIAMAERNLAVYEQFRQIYRQGAREIQALAVPSGSPAPASTLLVRFKALFPAYTRRGQALRSLWRPLKQILRRNGSSTVAVLEDRRNDPPPPGECDVLVQVGNFEAGGLENAALELNAALIKAGHRLTLLVLGKEGAAVERARAAGMQVVLGSSRDEYIQEVIQALHPKLVLAHYSIHGAELYSRASIPLVQVLHNAYMWFDAEQQAQFQRAAQSTAAFIAVSGYVRDYSVRRLGVPEQRCFVLPWGVHIAAFDSLDAPAARRQLRAQYGIDENEFVFLSIGAINHQKNHIATVRAFASTMARMPSARLVLLGPAYEKSLLEEIQLFVERHNLHARVAYLGSVQEAYRYYAMADAFVSASFFEGCALSILEAVRADLPLIMTRVGLYSPFREIPGVCVIDPPLDIFEFRGRIWQLTSNPRFEERLAAAMLETYRNPQRPALSASALKALDQSEALKPYVELVDHVMQRKSLAGKTFSTWVDQMTLGL